MTTTPLINPMCKQQKQHMIVYLGLGLCCLHDYRNDRVIPPRSYTKPLPKAA